MATRPVIVPHESFESLLESLPREWFAPGASPVPQPIVIPSISFSDHLQLRVANRFGVCMGVDFLTSRDFIFRVLGDESREVWARQFLTWRLLGPVAAYAETLGITEPTIRDRFALAEMVADRFDQYGHFRPEIIHAWAAGKSPLPGGEAADGAADEAWQRELWATLRRDAGVMHPAEQFARLRADENFGARLAKRFPRLLVLGSGVLDPLLVQTLDLLAAAGAHVEAHVILPSREFLGDLRTRRMLPAIDEDPEAITMTAAHPLLESMGRQAVGAFLLLGRLDDQYTFWPDAPEGAPTGTTLLRRLQADIRGLRPPSEGALSGDDLSIRVHSCFGPRRELEVLKDEILRAFADMPDLRPEEIHVVTPSLEIYQPLVPAILESGAGGLPIGLLERPAGDGHSVINALLTILEMTREGRYGASWLMELLQLEAVQAALGVAGNDDAVDRLRATVRRSGITRGLDPAREGSWRFGRDRLIAGRWFGPDDAATYPDDSFVLPVATQLSQDEDGLRRFVEWFAHLEATMRVWQELAPAAEWARRLEAAGTTLLAGEDAGLALRPFRDFLRRVTSEELVDADTMADWLAGESSEEGRRGQVSGRIAFGRLRQLQNIPCRVLAMVGLQEGVFPGQDRAPAWDLLKRSPRVWDRNLRVDDRQLFLDALLTPSDRLIITGSTRNVRTRKDEPFSPCVDELLRVTERMGAPRATLVIEHRLQPFAPDYFDHRGALPPSFQADFVRVAEELRRPTAGGDQPFFVGSRTDARPGSVSLDALIAFWRFPARAFLRAQGLQLPGDADDDEALDRVEVSLEGLETWKVRTALTDDVVFGQRNVRLVEARLRADRALPPGQLGAAVWDHQRSAVAELAARLGELKGDTPSREVSLGDEVTVSGLLPFSREGKHLLFHRVTEFAAPRHYLPAWITAVFAAAGGESRPSLLLDPVSARAPDERPAISPTDGVAILRDLVAGYFEGQRSPLAFAPGTSNALVAAFEKSGDAGKALAAAAAEWEKEGWGAGGEGTTLEAGWAWRDRNPFDDAAAWNEWAHRVAAPLRAWGGF